MCENGVGMTCASDGSFALEYFSDSYCMEPSGSTYDQLQTLNSNMNTYTNCQNVYQYGDQYGNVLVPYLMSVSYPCTSLVSGLCADSAAAETRHEIASSNGGGMISISRKSSSGRQTWLTKLKYVAGGLLLLASFVMFTGILFTNRRRRRALMQRKYRQARRSGDDRSRRSSRSKSKGRERDSSRKSRRSSRSRDAREKEKAGVFT